MFDAIGQIFIAGNGQIFTERTIFPSVHTAIDPIPS